MGKSKATGRPKRRRQLSPDDRAKIVADNKGRTHTLEARARISAAQRRRPRRPLSDETKAKISAANKGRIYTPEQRERMAAARKGRTLSLEHRAKISAANKGRPHPHLSSEARAKIVAANKRRTITPETRARMSAAHRGRPCSAETRAKISRANRRPRMLLAQFLGTIPDDGIQGGSARRPKSATYREADNTLPILDVGKPGEPARIGEVEVPPLTRSERDIIAALLDDKSREGLTDKQIKERSGRGGWWRTLRRLRESHSLWQSILPAAGQPWGRHRILARKPPSE